MGWSLGIDGKVVDDLCNFGGWSTIKTLISPHASTVPQLGHFAEEGFSTKPEELLADVATFQELSQEPGWVAVVLHRLASNVSKHPGAQIIYVSDGFEPDDGEDEGYEGDDLESSAT